MSDDFSSDPPGSSAGPTSPADVDSSDRGARGAGPSAVGGAASTPDSSTPGGAVVTPDPSVAHDAAATSAAPATAGTAEPAETPDSSPTILVVDDQADIRALLRDVLELESYTVVEAGDGSTALDMIEQSPPDLIVLDDFMPRLRGLDVLRQLRSAGSRLPIIVLTAYGDDEQTWQGWRSGATLFMDKPFDPPNLLAWIDRILHDDRWAGRVRPDHDLASHHFLGDAEPS